MKKLRIRGTLAIFSMSEPLLYISSEIVEIKPLVISQKMK